MIGMAKFKELGVEIHDSKLEKIRGSPGTSDVPLLR
jgi:hypothetical protein